MSLYNMLFGKNKLTPIILEMLGKNEDDFGRFRNVFYEDGHILVYTRCGGGNRDDYEEVFEEMRAHPNFVKDYDDDFDCTYCTFKFTVPDEFKSCFIENDVVGEKQWEMLFERLNKNT